MAALHTKACEARRHLESERAGVQQEILDSCCVLVGTKGAFANLGALNEHGLRGRRIDLLCIDEIGAITVFQNDMSLVSLEECLDENAKIHMAGDPNQIRPLLVSLHCLEYLQTNYAANLSLAVSFLRSIEGGRWHPVDIVDSIYMSNRFGRGKRLRGVSADFLTRLSQLRFGQTVWADMVGAKPVWSSLQGRTDAEHVADRLLDERLPEICLVSPQFPGVAHAQVCGYICKSRWFADVALLSVCTAVVAGLEWRRIRREIVRDPRVVEELTPAGAEEWANRQANVLIQTAWSAQADLCRAAAIFPAEL